MEDLLAGVSLPICEMGFFSSLLCFWLFPFGLQCPPFLGHTAKYTVLLLLGLVQMPPPPGSLPSCPPTFLQFKETSPSDSPRPPPYCSICRPLCCWSLSPQIRPIGGCGTCPRQVVGPSRVETVPGPPCTPYQRGAAPRPLGVGEGCPGRARRRLGKDDGR